VPNNILVIKLRRIRWAGNMACIEENTKASRILIGKTKMKEATWKVLGADGRIILKRSLEDE